MKNAGRIVLVVIGLMALLWLAVLVGGCSGVVTNAKYSTLIDKTALLSDATAARAQVMLADGIVTPEEGKYMADSLTEQAKTWNAIKSAKDGKAGAQ
jgi:hypothetical protein